MSISPWLRVGAYCAAVLAVSSAWGAHLALAAADRALLRLAGAAMSFAGAQHQQAPRTLAINGATLRLSVGTTEAPVAAVVDHFAAVCRRRSGNLGAHLTAALANAQAQLPQDLTRDWGVYRVVGESHGVVACLDVGEASLDLAQWLQRAQRFLADGDLAELGHVRFVSVERGEQRTVFAGIWSEQSLPLARMFPAAGDAPGDDLVGVPRPAGGRRLLSAREREHDPTIVSYAIEASGLAQAQRQYESLLRSAGFAPMPRQTAQVGTTLALSAARTLLASYSVIDAQHVLVTISVLHDATDATRFR